MSRAGDAARLAPVAPPCFDTRDAWTEYVRAAATAQLEDHIPGPLIVKQGAPSKWNPAFGFCHDCTDRHQGAMQAAKRCEPRYLILLAMPAKAKA